MPWRILLAIVFFSNGHPAYRLGQIAILLEINLKDLIGVEIGA